MCIVWWLMESFTDINKPRLKRKAVVSSFYLISVLPASLSPLACVLPWSVHTTLVRTDQREITCFKLQLAVNVNVTLTGILIDRPSRVRSGSGSKAAGPMNSQTHRHATIERYITESIRSPIVLNNEDHSISAKIFPILWDIWPLTNKQTCFHMKNFSGVQCLVLSVE